MSATLPGQDPATPPAEQLKLAETLLGGKVERVGKESAGVMRTKRRKADLARGVHPLTKLALRAEGGTCRGCAHAVKVNGGNRDYWKCSRVGFSHGPASDLRVSWPACTGYVGREATAPCEACDGRGWHHHEEEVLYPPRKDGSPSKRRPQVRRWSTRCETCASLGWVLAEEGEAT